MMWRVTLQSFAVLGRKWRDLAQEYNKVITGQDREEPRWEQCMASLTGSLGIALSSLYVRNHFKGNYRLEEWTQSSDECARQAAAKRRLWRWWTTSTRSSCTS